MTFEHVRHTKYSKLNRSWVQFRWHRKPCIQSWVMHDIKALVLLKMSNKFPEVLLDLSVHTPVLESAWCNFSYLAAKLRLQEMQLMDMSRGHIHEEIEQWSLVTWEYSEPKNVFMPVATNLEGEAPNQTERTRKFLCYCRPIPHNGSWTDGLTKKTKYNLAGNRGSYKEMGRTIPSVFSQRFE